jgi:hypothetical protein
MNVFQYGFISEKGNSRNEQQGHEQNSFHGPAPKVQLSRNERKGAEESEVPGTMPVKDKGEFRLNNIPVLGAKEMVGWFRRILAEKFPQLVRLFTVSIFGTRCRKCGQGCKTSLHEGWISGHLKKAHPEVKVGSGGCAEFSWYANKLTGELVKQWNPLTSLKGLDDSVVYCSDLTCGKRFRNRDSFRHHYPKHGVAIPAAAYIFEDGMPVYDNEVKAKFKQFEEFEKDVHRVQAKQRCMETKAWMRANEEHRIPYVVPTNFELSDDGKVLIEAIRRRTYTIATKKVSKGKGSSSKNVLTTSKHTKAKKVHRELVWKHRVSSANVPVALAKLILKHRTMRDAFLRKDRLYYEGVRYGDINEEDWTIIDVRKNGDSYQTKVDVELPECVVVDGKSTKMTTITVADASTATDCIDAISDVAMKIHLSKSGDGKGNCRAKVGDYGPMTGLGWLNYAKKVLYKPTMLVRDVLPGAMKLVGALIRLICPDMYDGLAKYNVKEDELMGGLFGAGQQVMITENYSNSAHTDPFDQSKTFVLWFFSKKCPDVENLFFLFPDATIDGKRGLAVKLFHGAVISWDGRLLRHGTSIARPVGGGTFQTQRNIDDHIIWAAGFVACKTSTNV